METKKACIISAVILAISIIYLGDALKRGFDNFTYKDRCVTVRGLSEMEVPADNVICPLVFKEVGGDLHAINAEVRRKNQLVKAYLLSKGISEQDISIAAPAVIDNEADRWGTQRPLYRYNVTSVVTVNSSDVEKVRTAIEHQTELIDKGVALVSDDYQYRVVYQFTKLNDIKPQMIEDATKNARAAAEKFAADSDSELGKIKRATQGQFSIDDRDEFTPEIKKVRVVTSVEYYLED